VSRVLKEERLCVVKVGGSLLRDADSYLGAAQSIKHEFIDRGYRPIIVVSAAKGVTDKLIEASQGSREALNNVIELYLAMAEKLGFDKVIKHLMHIHKHLEKIISCAGGVDARLRDYIVSFGERISKMLLIEALESLGIEAVGVDATELIVTSSVFGNADIDYSLTAKRLEKLLDLLTMTRAIPVIEGFIGATIDGEVTTLGRGGSDYTATAIAALLRIDEVYLVTDTNGIMSCDPHITPNAKVVSVLSYLEANEAALHRVKGLNQKTFDPLTKLYTSTVYIGFWQSFGTKVIPKTSTRFKGPKIVAHGAEPNGESYIAIIGEGVNELRFAKLIIDILSDVGGVVGVKFSKYKPVLVAHIEHGNELKAVKAVHDELLYRGELVV
jgi:aspartate kinase